MYFGNRSLADQQKFLYETFLSFLLYNSPNIFISVLLDRHLKDLQHKISKYITMLIVENASSMCIYVKNPCTYGLKRKGLGHSLYYSKLIYTKVQKENNKQMFVTKGSAEVGTRCCYKISFAILPYGLSLLLRSFTLLIKGSASALDIDKLPYAFSSSLSPLLQQLFM